MKVRIGVALGGQGLTTIEGYGAVLDDLERLGFDSVWLPETFLAGTLDPLVGLAYAAGRVPRLKLGTHLIGPGRNPYGLAKSLAQLDRLSGGRLLLTFVAGLNDPAERRAQGLPTGDRTTWFDEHLPRIRGWWAGEEVDGLTLDARPAQQPLEVWLGGQVPAALARAGRLGDGWLPGAITISDAVAARADVNRAAEAAGRSISREHFGINISYTLGETMPELPPARARGDVRDVVAVGGGALRDLLRRWIDAGFTKFVVRPLSPPDDWSVELDALAATVLDLQT
jgi:probable F420-dependent oxidoreductase